MYLLMSDISGNLPLLKGMVCLISVPGALEPGTLSKSSRAASFSLSTVFLIVPKSLSQLVEV